MRDFRIIVAATADGMGIGRYVLFCPSFGYFPIRFSRLFFLLLY